MADPASTPLLSPPSHFSQLCKSDIWPRRLDLFASPSSSLTRRGFTFLNWFPPSPQAMRPRRTLSRVIRDYADTLFVFNVLFRSIAAERHRNF